MTLAGTKGSWRRRRLPPTPLALTTLLPVLLRPLPCWHQIQPPRPTPESDSEFLPPLLTEQSLWNSALGTLPRRRGTAVRPSNFVFIAENPDTPFSLVQT